MTIHLIHLCQLSSSQTIRERTFGGFFFPSPWIIAQSPILVPILASHTSLTRLLTQTFYDREWEDALKCKCVESDCESPTSLINTQYPDSQHVNMTLLYNVN